MQRVITLTTDFGNRDPFVGTMKGVILGLAPNAATVDLTHEVSPGDIRAAAFGLRSAYAFFPRGTIHVAVVDPGVGSSRPPIAVQTRRYIFVGPDNGVLSWALREEQILGIRRLSNTKLHLSKVSHTFHGRDIFAPVAAHLAKGIGFGRVGETQAKMVELPWPEVVFTAQAVRGEVLYVDTFGNAITNIPSTYIADQNASVIAGGSRIPCAQFYAAVPVGKPAAIPGSSGFVEIAVNRGNAARKLRLKPGSKVRLLQTAER